MTSHGSGANKGVRQGCISVIHTFLLDLTNLDQATTTLKLLSLAASEKKPVCFKTSALVITPFDDGTQRGLSIGIAENGTTILNGVDVQAAAGTSYAPSGTNAFEMITTDTDIWAKVTATDEDSTEGQVLVNIEVWDVNVQHVYPED